MGARNHKELAIWRFADELRIAVIAATATDRVASDRKFCDQLRRAIEDATSDIAEGYTRFYPREFARFLDYALSSLQEVRTRTEHAYGRGYFTGEVAADLLRRWAIADRSVRSMRRYLWSVREEDLPNHLSSPPRRPKRQTRKR
jgi:four helix bundle protein